MAVDRHRLTDNASTLRNRNVKRYSRQVYLKENLGDSAVQVFGGLVQRFPDNTTFRYHYGLSLSQKGQRARGQD